MIGIASSSGAPRSSIMFLMSIERSATLRSITLLAKRLWEVVTMRTGDDLDIVRAGQLDLLLAFRCHRVW